MEPTITNLPDGCVRVCLGHLCATTSSHHLVPPKLNQLRRLHQATTVKPLHAAMALRTIPAPGRTGATDIDAMANRHIVMEWLYRLSGRTNGLYTGLYRDALAEIRPR